MTLLLLLGSCGVTHVQCCCLPSPVTDCGAAGRNTTVTVHPCLTGQRVSLYVDWRDSNIGGGPIISGSRVFNGNLNESFSYFHVYAQPGKYRPVIQATAYINDTATEQCSEIVINTVNTDLEIVVGANDCSGTHQLLRLAGLLLAAALTYNFF
jgi:hypothetical protein